MPAQASDAASELTRPSIARGVRSTMIAPMIGLMNPAPNPPPMLKPATTQMGRPADMASSRGGVVIAKPIR